ncbi:tail fiber domain-containing protein [Tropicimonas marinistellae]|uniref:tail fiber domain-containing protein n=1 Tax=Tropicimonas marinistellae TaxID=1739787 RepID=UPI00122E1D25|nr:tail fiber domain-containing protein [Tropicimonas marinistellae]
MKNAETGEAYLAHMMGHAGISNRWARQDRARYQNIFVPLEDELVEEAQNWDTRWRRGQRANEMEADVIRSIAGQRDSTNRQLAVMGVNPASGRSKSIRRADSIQTGLARAGARTIGKRQVQQEGDAKMVSAINLGHGMAVNPADSLRISNGAIVSGHEGAMRGYESQGRLLDTQYQQQLQSWQANQSSNAGLWGGIGSAAGLMLLNPAILGAISSRKAKEHKRPPKRSLLNEVREAPVEQWKYKDGIEDGGEHIGSYAEDVSRASGGRRPADRLDLMDEIGTTKGAVQELDRQVQGMARDVKAIARSLPHAKGEAGGTPKHVRGHSIPRSMRKAKAA